LELRDGASHVDEALQGVLGKEIGANGDSQASNGKYDDSKEAGLAEAEQAGMLSLKCMRVYGYVRHDAY